MSAAAPRLELLHPSLNATEPATPLEHAPLTDRQRLGVLLEGCALLAHLADSGAGVLPLWSGAAISGDGRLVGVELAAGAARETPAQARAAKEHGRGMQVHERGTKPHERGTKPHERGTKPHELASDLLRRLFAGGEPPGRGEARRAARALARRWSLCLVPADAHELVADVLDAAPFLWRESAACYRESLAAVWAGERGERVMVAGPAGFRRRLLRSSPALCELRATLRAPEVRLQWGVAPAAVLVGERPLPASWTHPAPAVSPTGAAIPLEPSQLAAALRSRSPAGVERSLLWLELGRARRRAGAAGGAERCFRHALRHARRSDPAQPGLQGESHPRRGGGEARELWWAAAELLATRLRRGEVGDEEVAMRVGDVARAASDRECELRAEALAVRLDLVRGRCEQAARRASRVLSRRASRLPARGRSAVERRGAALEIEVLAARALGWIGRGREAASALERAGDGAALEALDPEELPAVWALAGRPDRALAAAAALGSGEAWRRLLDEGVVEVDLLAPGVDGFRRARLLHDAALLGGRPCERDRREACAVLDAIGAADWAHRLRAAQAATPPLVVAQGRDAAPSPLEPDAIVGSSPVLRAVLDRVDRLARGSVPVLLLGETGTGKELVARRLHRGSSRREGPFLAVNCAALSESLLLSELFGHVRGAFTGAERDRAGIFEAAQGGVAFLDEIGDLPMPAQGALLRVLQEQEVRRLGEARPRRVDVRVVAATHRDLAAEVARGVFRRDLFYRLAVAAVVLPPLRERGRDAVMLARHFLAETGTGLRLSPEAEERLLASFWPGNVRELRSVVQVAATLHAEAEGGLLRARDLELDAAERPTLDYHAALEAERRRLVVDALAAACGRRVDAARLLGITPQAVSYLVRRLGLEAIAEQGEAQRREEAASGARRAARAASRSRLGGQGLS